MLAQSKHVSSFEVDNISFPLFRSFACTGTIGQCETIAIGEFFLTPKDSMLLQKRFIVAKIFYCASGRSGILAQHPARILCRRRGLRSSDKKTPAPALQKPPDASKIGAEHAVAAA